MTDQSIEVTDSDEQEAVRNGEIEGDVYRDGAVFADTASLLKWRELRAQGEAA